jgi:ABC-type microcin C transport system permease subunit YejB
MLKYIVKRIAVFIPTLFAISLLAFAISINSPGDPVEILYSGSKGGEAQSAQSESALQGKKQLRHQLGLDLPVFYFTFTSFASSDTIYRVANPDEKEALNRLTDTYGNWKEVSAWYHSLQQLKSQIAKVVPDSFSYRLLGNETADKHLDDARQEIQ